MAIARAGAAIGVLRSVLGSIFGDTKSLAVSRFWWQISILATPKVALCPSSRANFSNLAAFWPRARNFAVFQFSRAHPLLPFACDTFLNFPFFRAHKFPVASLRFSQFSLFRSFSFPSPLSLSLSVSSLLFYPLFYLINLDDQADRSRTIKMARVGQSGVAEARGVLFSGGSKQ